MPGVAPYRHIRRPSRNGTSPFRWRRTTVVLGCLSIIFLWCSYARNKVKTVTAEMRRLEAQTVISSCPETEQTPTVALMFLTYGRLHNEPVWRAFFEAAGRLCMIHDTPGSNIHGRPPSRALQGVGHDGHLESWSRNCSEEDAMIEAEVKRLMSTNWKNTDLIQRQSLFTVYVNSNAYDSLDEPSIFKGSVIEEPMDTNGGYAQFALVAATLRMIQYALLEPKNKKFVLLSESCVPIHPPEVVHAQLIAEPRSRINACRVGNPNFGRWNPNIVNRTSWRKSSQFIALRRDHVRLAVNDSDLRARFRANCFTTWHPIRRLCIADEHFFPTLLAHHNRSNQTDCQGYVTSSEWDTHRDPWHPISYESDDINSELFKRLASYGKAGQLCEIEKTRASTGMIYTGFSQDSCVPRGFDLPKKRNATIVMIQRGYQPLLYPCPLFSRKYKVEVVERTVRAALSCNGTGLGQWCY